MKTKEQLKSEISALQHQLELTEVLDGFVKRLEQCKRHGKHKWQMDKWEERVEMRDYHSWDTGPVVHYTPSGGTLMGKLFCDCGAQVTYEQDC